MKISDIGEFNWIERIKKLYPQVLPDGIRGIGDDCAAVPWDKDYYKVFTTDMLIENTHFLLNEISAYELGHKSLAVNLSDIAACGAKPETAFLSIGLPPDTSVAWTDEFFKGFFSLAKKYNTFLLGGDSCKSQDSLIINVLVTGIIKKDHYKSRDTAKTADLICVNGNLGDSGGGLRCILNKIERNKDIEFLIKKHHLPEPQINEGMFLSEFKGVTAMMDVSDGLGSDLKRIIDDSAKGMIIDLENLPISKEIKSVSEQLNWNIFEVALKEGEDYCLLLTINPDEYEMINNAYLKKFGKKLVVIGKVTDKDFDKNSDPVYRLYAKVVDTGKDAFRQF